MGARSDRAFLALALLGIVLAPAWSADNNAGTSGALFLTLGGGARPAGMGEAFTALADDVNTVAYNPAGLGRLTAPEFTAMHTQWLQGADYEFLAAAHPFSWGTLGLGAATLSVDSLEKRAGDTDAADGTFDASDAVYLVSYGKALGETLSLGANIKYIRQTLDTASASAWSTDLGALWQTPHQPLSLGLALRHAGPELKFNEEADPQPRTVSGGAAYRLWNDRLSLSTDLRHGRDTGWQFGLGGEFTQTVTADLKGRLRVGHSSAGTDVSEGLTGFSLGLGVSWRSFGFDTAWVPYGALGHTFRHALHVKF